MNFTTTAIRCMAITLSLCIAIPWGPLNEVAWSASNGIVVGTSNNGPGNYPVVPALGNADSAKPNSVGSISNVSFNSSYNGVKAQVVPVSRSVMSAINQNTPTPAPDTTVALPPTRSTVPSVPGSVTVPPPAASAPPPASAPGSGSNSGLPSWAMVLGGLVLAGALSGNKSSASSAPSRSVSGTTPTTGSGTSSASGTTAAANASTGSQGTTGGQQAGSSSDNSSADNGGFNLNSLLQFLPIILLLTGKSSSSTLLWATLLPSLLPLLTGGSSGGGGILGNLFGGGGSGGGGLLGGLLGGGASGGNGTTGSGDSNGNSTSGGLLGLITKVAPLYLAYQATQSQQNNTPPSSIMAINTVTGQMQQFVRPVQSSGGSNNNNNSLTNLLPLILGGLGGQNSGSSQGGLGSLTSILPFLLQNQNNNNNSAPAGAVNNSAWQTATDAATLSGQQGTNNWTEVQANGRIYMVPIGKFTNSDTGETTTYANDGSGTVLNYTYQGKTLMLDTSTGNPTSGTYLLSKITKGPDGVEADALSSSQISALDQVDAALSGQQILQDVSAPALPSFVTALNPNSPFANQSTGLFLYKVSDPSHPELGQFIPIGFHVNADGTVTQYDDQGNFQFLYDPANNVVWSLDPTTGAKLQKTIIVNASLSLSNLGTGTTSRLDFVTSGPYQGDYKDQLGNYYKATTGANGTVYVPVQAADSNGNALYVTDSNNKQITDPKTGSPIPVAYKDASGKAYAFDGNGNLIPTTQDWTDPSTNNPITLNLQSAALDTYADSASDRVLKLSMSSSGGSGSQASLTPYTGTFQLSPGTSATYAMVNGAQQITSYQTNQADGKTETLNLKSGQLYEVSGTNQDYQVTLNNGQPQFTPYSGTFTVGTNSETIVPPDASTTQKTPYLQTVTDRLTGNSVTYNAAGVPTGLTYKGQSYTGLTSIQPLNGPTLSVTEAFKTTVSGITLPNRIAVTDNAASPPSAGSAGGSSLPTAPTGMPQQEFTYSVDITNRSITITDTITGATETVSYDINGNPKPASPALDSSQLPTGFPPSGVVFPL